MHPACIDGVLRDIEGRLIRTFNFDISYNNVQIPITTNDLPSGIYFLQLSGAEGVVAKKLVIE